MDDLHFAPLIYIAVRIDRFVSSKIRDIVFSEPSGKLHAFVMFAGSHIYYVILRDGSSISSLILAIGFSLSRFAESLPTEHQQITGGLRVTAILWLLSLLGLTIFAPDVILDTR